MHKTKGKNAAICLRVFLGGTRMSESVASGKYTAVSEQSVASEDWIKLVGKSIIPTNQYDDAFLNRYMVSRKSWIEYLKLALVWILLGPIRLVCIFSIIGINAVLLRVLLLGQAKKVLSVNKPQPLWLRRVLIFTGVISSRVVLFLLGFIRIKTVRHEGSSPGLTTWRMLVDPERQIELDPNAEEPFTPMIVSNHVSWVDIFYFISEICPGFVAKSSVQKTPCIGDMAKAYNSCFVDRATRDSGQTVQNHINGRFTTLRVAGLKYPPLVVFPEGTTSNGSSLIQFRRGAFVPGVPVQPVVLRYPHSSFDCSFTTPPSMWYLLYMVGQVYNQLEVHWLPVYHPSEEEIANPDLYAANVRQHMSDAVGLPLSACTNRNKFEFMAQFLPKTLQEGKSDTVKPVKQS